MWSLLAWLGLAVGVGIGLLWLLDDGLSSTAALGLVALLAGLAAAGYAGSAIWRATRGWRRALALAAWLLALALATFVLGLALAATRPSPSPVPDPPAGLPGDEVQLATPDGTTLAGWYVPGTTRAAVVVRHGSGSQRFDTAAQAAVLADAGFTVLLTDARGHGRSGGRAMDFGWWGEQDIRAAVDFLAAQPGVDPDRIGVLGMSMGGEEAIGAAAVDPRIRAVVAEGATWRTAEDRSWLSEEYGLAGHVQEALDAATYGVAELLTSAPRPSTLREAVVAGSAPVLLIAGGTMPDEQLAAERLAAAAPGRVQVWTVPGAGHIAGLAVAGEAWERRVVDFLEGALAPGD